MANKCMVSILRLKTVITFCRIFTEIIYKEDLEVLRQNGWSLMGLYKSLLAQGKMDEATLIKAEYDKAWENADIEIDTSVL